MASNMLPSYLEPIDVYCERLGVGLLAEPLNLISNGAFFIACWLAWRFSRAEPRSPIYIDLLMLLMLLIAIGSSLFHSFANRLTMLMDVIPIGVFQFVYIACFAWFIARQSWFRVGALLAVFLLLGWATAWVPDPYRFNGTISYTPALLFVIGMGYYAFSRYQLPQLYMASYCLMFSMLMRSIDPLLCGNWPHGTHFLWHIGNGAVLYFALKGMILAHRKTRI